MVRSSIYILRSVFANPGDERKDICDEKVVFTGRHAADGCGAGGERRGQRLAAERPPRTEAQIAGDVEAPQRRGGQRDPRLREQLAGDRSGSERSGLRLRGVRGRRQGGVDGEDVLGEGGFLPGVGRAQKGREDRTSRRPRLRLGADKPARASARLCLQHVRQEGDGRICHRDRRLPAQGHRFG